MPPRKTTTSATTHRSLRNGRVGSFLGEANSSAQPSLAACSSRQSCITTRTQFFHIRRRTDSPKVEPCLAMATLAPPDEMHLRNALDKELSLLYYRRWAILRMSPTPAILLAFLFPPTSSAG